MSASRDQNDAWDFLDSLCDLSADAWYQIACRLHPSSLSTSARTELSAIVRRECLGLSTWYLNDGLDTVAWYVVRVLAPGEPQHRLEAFRVAIAAARSAAVALLVRRRLGERRFWLLYEPFQLVFPQRRWRSSSTRVFTESSCAPTAGGATVRRIARIVR